jgi:hypothetical protein
MAVYLGLAGGDKLLLVDGVSGLLLSPSEGDGVELSCSITITAPIPIPTVGTKQWRLHQFSFKARTEQTS